MRPYSHFGSDFHDLHGEDLSAIPAETHLGLVILAAVVAFVLLFFAVGLALGFAIFGASAFWPHPEMRLEPDLIAIGARAAVALR